MYVFLYLCLYFMYLSKNLYMYAFLYVDVCV